MTAEDAGTVLATARAAVGILTAVLAAGLLLWRGRIMRPHKLRLLLAVAAVMTWLSVAAVVPALPAWVHATAELAGMAMILRALADVGWRARLWRPEGAPSDHTNRQRLRC